MAHMILVGNLIKSLENSEYVLGVLLDFSKAFDAINHSILLYELCHYGIKISRLPDKFNWLDEFRIM